MEIKKDCIKVLSDFYGVDLTSEQFDDIISRQTEYWRDILADGYPRDTMVREMLIDMVSKDFGLSQWPLNGSTQEYTSTFFANFSKIAADRGYKLNLD